MQSLQALKKLQDKLLIRYVTRCNLYAICLTTPVKGCNQGTYVFDYTDTAMDVVDNLLLNFYFINLVLEEYGRYCDDTSTPWSHGLDKLLIFEQALDDVIADIYSTIRFRMSYDSKRIQCLDLNIDLEGGYLKTTLVSKPADNHEYLNIRSWHQDSVYSNNRCQ